MAGIRLPDIGRLGIRIATGIKDRKRVAPNDMVEHTRLKTLSQRLDTEKKERHRILVKEQRQIRNKKRKIDSRRLQISKARKEVGGHPFHEKLINFYPAYTDQMVHSRNSTARHHRRVKFADLSLGRDSQRNVRTERSDRDCTVISGMFLRSVELKESVQHPIISSSLFNESYATKLHFRLPSIVGQRQHEGTKPTKRKTRRLLERDLHSDVKRSLKSHNLKVLPSTNYDKSQKAISVLNIKEEIFQTESPTNDTECIVEEELFSSNHDVIDRNENEIWRIREHERSTEQTLDRNEPRSHIKIWKKLS